MADIKLPEFNEVNLKNNDSPPLFLSLPDQMNEYKTALALAKTEISD